MRTPDLLDVLLSLPAPVYLDESYDLTSCWSAPRVARGSEKVREMCIQGPSLLMSSTIWSMEMWNDQPSPMNVAHARLDYDEDVHFLFSSMFRAVCPGLDLYSEHTFVNGRLPQLVAECDEVLHSAAKCRIGHDVVGWISTRRFRGWMNDSEKLLCWMQLRILMRAVTEVRAFLHEAWVCGLHVVYIGL